MRVWLKNAQAQIQDGSLSLPDGSWTPIQTMMVVRNPPYVRRKDHLPEGAAYIFTAYTREALPLITAMSEGEFIELAPAGPETCLVIHMQGAPGMFGVHYARGAIRTVVNRFLQDTATKDMSRYVLEREGPEAGLRGTSAEDIFSPEIEREFAAIGRAAVFNPLSGALEPYVGSQQHE